MSEYVQSYFKIKTLKQIPAELAMLKQLITQEDDQLLQNMIDKNSEISKILNLAKSYLFQMKSQQTLLSNYISAVNQHLQEPILQIPPAPLEHTQSLSILSQLLTNQNNITDPSLSLLLQLISGSKINFLLHSEHDAHILEAYFRAGNRSSQSLHKAAQITRFGLNVQQNFSLNFVETALKLVEMGQKLPEIYAQNVRSFLFSQLVGCTVCEDSGLLVDCPVAQMQEMSDFVVYVPLGDEIRQARKMQAVVRQIVSGVGQIKNFDRFVENCKIMERNCIKIYIQMILSGELIEVNIKGIREDVLEVCREEFGKELFCQIYQGDVILGVLFGEYLNEEVQLKCEFLMQQ